MSPEPVCFGPYYLRHDRTARGMTDVHPPVCSPEAIARTYRPGLRIVWEQNGTRDVWDVVSVDGDGVTTRFTASDGTVTTATATFAELSSHSAFPVGDTVFEDVEFTTPAGSFRGTRCTVSTPDGSRRFHFSATHPGPPIKIESDGFLRQQVERNDL